MPCTGRYQSILSFRKFSFFDVYPRIIIFGLFLALLLIFVLPAETKRIYFTLGWLTGLVWLFECNKPAKLIRPLLYMMLLFLLYRTGHAIWVQKTWKPIDLQPEQTLLVAGIFLGYLSSKPWNMLSLNSVFLWVLRTFLLLATFLTVISIFYLNLDRAHFWNGYNIIHFSGITIAVFLVFFACWIQRNQYSFLSLIDLLLMSTMVFACVYFSETRNVLFVLLVVSSLLYLLSCIPYKKIIAVFGLMVCIIVLSIYGGKLIAQFRLDKVASDISTYQENPNQSTSIGLRFEMWRTSFLVTEEAPIFGIGYDKRAEKIKHLIEEKQINPSVGDFYNMHSDYMEEVSIRGIVGLALLILLYFFMAKLSFVKKHTEGIVMPLLAIPVTLALLGLPDNFLINRSAFFVFCILYILSFALNRQRFLDTE